MQPLRIPAFRLISTSLIFTLLLALAARGFADSAVEVAKDPNFPHLRQQGTSAQLIVDGQPLVMLAGELHNSSSSSLDYLRPIWPRLASLNLNTVVASLSWELVEPEEGKYDFALLDGIISAARAHDLKLVLIWFATWKNADSTYVPAWVKTNTKRFPRCQHRPGQNSTQLSALSEDAMKADARAYAAVMKHIREADAKRHTVVMMQVENESGVRPVSRDHSPAAEAAFAAPVPAELMKHLVANKAKLIPEMKEAWGKSNFRESGTWSEVFGPAADEAFMAWHVARYINFVTAAGKAEYPIPMYANAWLVQRPGQPAGQYPSGGPVARMMDVWHAAAPAIDLLAPDIYLDDFKAVCAEYTQQGNPLFIPEARRDELAGCRALYAFGHHHALGFSPFGIDSVASTSTLGAYYAMLAGLAPLIAKHQGQPTMQGFMQYGEEETLAFDLGDFRAEIDYPRERDKKPAKGAGIVIALAPDTFLMAGVNYNIRFSSGSKKRGNTDWLSIEEGKFEDGKWVPGRRLNGDEATYKAKLGPAPSILIGRVYRFD